MNNSKFSGNAFDNPSVNLAVFPLVSGKFSGLFDNILSGVTTGFGIGSQIWGMSQANNPPKAQCYKRVQGCLDVFLPQYRSALTVANTTQAKLQVAIAFLATLNDPQVFDQNHKDGKALLDSTKREIGNKINELQTQLESEVTASATAVVPASSGVTGLIGGGDNTLLLYSAVAVIGAIFLARK